MFGPNVRPTFNATMPYFHHREPAYRQLLTQVVQELHHRLGISYDYDLVVLTGSGTLANEAVIWSLFGDIATHSYQGEFTGRLRRLIRAHNKEAHGEYRHQAMVQYETAEGKFLTPEWAEGQAQAWGVRVADCVSSFPYYAPPASADVWTTVSSKQLGSVPVLSIVAVRKAAWAWFKSPDFAYSYLNLRRYQAAYQRNRESPHTPAIGLLYDLYIRLRSFDVAELRARVDGRKALLCSAFGYDPTVVRGEGPVLTVQAGAIPLHMATHWNLYRSAFGWQFFLYSGTDQDYDDFIRDFRKSRSA